MNVIVNVDANLRLVVRFGGGFDLESFVPGPGWVIDNEADMPDSALECYLDAAIVALQQAMSKIGGA